MSLRIIEIHFEETVKLAESIEKLAETSRKLAGEELQQIIGDMNAIWQSENRTRLARKEEKAVERLLKQADKMKKLAEDLEVQARRLYRAELANDLCARTRIY